MKYFKLLVAASCASIVWGCGSTPPMPVYAMPDPSAPSATLTVKRYPLYVGRRHGGGTLERQDIACTGDGKVASAKYSEIASFTYENNKTLDQVDTTLPAGPAHFWLDASEGDRRCTMAWSNILAAGHHYELSLNINTPGFLSFKSGSCQLVLKDATTGLNVPLLSHAKDENYGALFCARMRHE